MSKLPESPLSHRTIEELQAMAAHANEHAEAHVMRRDSIYRELRGRGVYPFAQDEREEQQQTDVVDGDHTDWFDQDSVPEQANQTMRNGDVADVHLKRLVAAIARFPGVDTIELFCSEDFAEPSEPGESGSSFAVAVILEATPESWRTLRLFALAIEVANGDELLTGTYELLVSSGGMRGPLIELAGIDFACPNLLAETVEEIFFKYCN